MNSSFFSSYFHLGDCRIVQSRGHRPATAARALCAAAPATARPFFGRRARGVRVSGDPAPPRYSGLGGAGRSHRLEGAGGAGRPERVGDTRWGRRSAAAAPRPGKKPARCGSAPGASGEETRAPPTNTNTQLRPSSSAPLLPSEPQLFLPLRLPARRRRRRPTSAPCGRDGPGGRASPRDTSALPTAVPGFGLSFKALRLLAAGCPRLCLGAERLSECPPI